MKSISGKQLRVLLVSPQDPPVPGDLKLLMGGENTYTKMLLKYPPSKCTYIEHTAALKQGMITYHWSYYAALWLQKLRILPPGPRALCFNGVEKFDVVYAHAHPTRYSTGTARLVISDSSSNIVFLRNYAHWSKLKIQIYQRIKRYIYDLLGLIDGENNTQKANHSFVFSHWAKNIKVAEFTNLRTEVLYPPVPVEVPKKKERSTKQINILFVGVWFERKGGRLLWNVFQKLTKTYKNIHLTILGELPPDLKILPKSHITHYSFVPYKKLCHFYTSHHILVHIPPEVEGYGMTVVEALAYGMNVVVSSVCALPELVGNGRAGLVIDANSEDALEGALVTLIKNPNLRKKVSKNAQKFYQRNFTPKNFNQKLAAFFRSNSSLRV